ncbi:hypothetical protein GINT2_001579 [Glugoides intestinalis]
MAPNEARNPANWDKIREIQFKTRIETNKSTLNEEKWPTLKSRNLVLIKQEINRKKNQPLFYELAEVLEVRNFDTYLLRKENRSLIKRHISQLKDTGVERGNVEIFDYLKTFK